MMVMNCFKKTAGVAAVLLIGAGIAFGTSPSSPNSLSLVRTKSTR